MLSVLCETAPMAGNFVFFVFVGIGLLWLYWVNNP